MPGPRYRVIQSREEFEQLVVGREVLTGLLDANGNPICRLPDPIGFQWD